MPQGFAVGSEFEALPVGQCVTASPKSQGVIHDLFKIGAALAAIILGSVSVALTDDLIGQASVIDGDTLEIHGSRIRLWAASRAAPYSWMAGTSPVMTIRKVHEHPVVDPHVSHFMQVPFRTSVKLPHSPHISPS
jgi:hypothetical protein